MKMKQKDRLSAKENKNAEYLQAGGRNVSEFGIILQLFVVLSPVPPCSPLTPVLPAPAGIIQFSNTADSSRNYSFAMIFA